MKNYVIAIDGPAASGKSTTARLVAQQLGWSYIDTGAMYRAVTLAVLRHGVSPDDVESVGRIADGCVISFESSEQGQRVRLNGEDVTTGIRTAAVTAAVSLVSSQPRVRQRMVALQRASAAHGSLVMDGRDIGTVVFPDADVKVFLIASLDQRARRRQTELERSGVKVELAALRAEIAARDRADAARTLSPLQKAADAAELDTTTLTIDEQVQFIMRLVRAAVGSDKRA